MIPAARTDAMSAPKVKLRASGCAESHTLNANACVVFSDTAACEPSEIENWIAVVVICMSESMGPAVVGVKVDTSK